MPFCHKTAFSHEHHHWSVLMMASHFRELRYFYVNLRSFTGYCRYGYWCTYIAHLRGTYQIIGDNLCIKLQIKRF